MPSRKQRAPTYSSQTPWWADALVLGGSVILAELIVILCLPLVVPGAEEDLLEGLADGLLQCTVLLPIFGWTLWRRQAQSALAEARPATGSPHRRMHAAMAGALLGVGALVIVSQLAHQLSVVSDHGAQLIGHAGRQGVLAQRLARQIHELDGARDGARLDAARSELADTFRQFDAQGRQVWHVQARLHHEDPEHHEPPEQLLAAAWRDRATLHRAALAALSRAPVAALIEPRSFARGALYTAADSFSREMDTAVHAMVREAEEHSAHMQQLDTLVIWVTALACIAGYFGVVAPVSRMLQSQHGALMGQQRLLRSVIDVLPQRIFWKDLAGRYRGGNAAFAAAGGALRLGSTDDESVGLWRDDDERRARERRVVATRSAELDVAVQLESGREARWLMTNTLPLLNDGGDVVGVLITEQDITDVKRVELDLRAARDAAEAASRAKTEFLANMSHEIRTPMTAILGYAELLREPELSEQARGEYVGTIQRSGEHLLTIINDILDMSKIEAGKMTCERVSTPLAPLLQDLGALMSARAAERGLTLRVEASSHLPPTILSDPVRLRQILLNLVGNSIKFTEVGGVTIRLAALRAQGGSVPLRIEIIDTGVGMSAEQLGRLFQAFEQADASTTRRFGGSGLGLRISQRLAELMGGRIETTSTPGVGTVMTVTLPVEAVGTQGWLSPEDFTQAAAARDPRSTTPADSAPPLTGKRILLAEDGPDNQRLISYHLRKAGAHVQVAWDGLQALALLCAGGDARGALLEQPPFDLLLTDMQMPEMDGYALARTLRARGSRLPIVALTAHAMSGEAQRCIAAGCDAYARKPIDKAQLLEILAVHLNCAGGRVASGRAYDAPAGNR